MIKKTIVSALAVTVLALGGASGALAEGDAAKGEKVYKKCKTCHTLEEGGKHKIGPNLHGLYGKTAGTAEGFTKYSQAMMDSGIVWDDDTLTPFLKKPKDYIDGTKMQFAGIKKDDQLADLLAYLKEATQ
jgi:cytochrome c